MKPIIGKLVVCFECVGSLAYVCRDKYLYSRCSKLFSYSELDYGAATVKKF
jgi:hypothetical protein